MVYDSGEIVRQRLIDYFYELSLTPYFKRPARTGLLTIEELWENRGKEIEPNEQIKKEDIILILDKDNIDLLDENVQFWIIAPYDRGIAWEDNPIWWSENRGGNDELKEKPIRIRDTPKLFGIYDKTSKSKLSPINVWDAIDEGWPPITQYRFFLMKKPKVRNKSLNFSRRSFL